MIKSGHCYRCKLGALLYPVLPKKAGGLVYVCYECRELIKRVGSRNAR